ncbi:MAG: multidrug transporter [Bacteroidia bacterium]|jgi:putative membrane protein|nr:multidrug transporter [Bacteroidia bacterium]
MHTGKRYTFKEVILWTRRDIASLLVIAFVPTLCYEVFHWKWLCLPWLPIALLGTAVAFVVGFKNNASYDRTWEARRIWGAIVNASRGWGVMCKDFISNRHAKQPLGDADLKTLQLALIKRHLAWLTALRFQLRESRNWESMHLAHNREYRNRWFQVEEHNQELNEQLKKYLSEAEWQEIQGKLNKAAQLLALQSRHLRELLELGYIEDFRHMELERVIVELYNQQGASERIKNFPYPRQFASLNNWFIKIFVALLPFGMMQEFEKLGDHLVWLTIPFSALSGWVFTTMERIGEVSENPFEGSSNDVPITAIARNIEIDLMDMFGVHHGIQPKQAENNILS